MTGHLALPRAQSLRCYGASARAFPQTAQRRFCRILKKSKQLEQRLSCGCRFALHCQCVCILERDEFFFLSPKDISILFRSGAFWKKLEDIGAYWGSGERTEVEQKRRRDA